MKYLYNSLISVEYPKTIHNPYYTNTRYGMREAISA